MRRKKVYFNIKEHDLLSHDDLLALSAVFDTQSIATTNWVAKYYPDGFFEIET